MRQREQRRAVRLRQHRRGAATPCCGEPCARSRPRRRAAPRAAGNGCATSPASAPADARPACRYVSGGGSSSVFSSAFAAETLQRFRRHDDRHLGPPTMAVTSAQSISARMYSTGIVSSGLTSPSSSISIGSTIRRSGCWPRDGIAAARARAAREAVRARRLAQQRACEVERQRALADAARTADQQSRAAMTRGRANASAAACTARAGDPATQVARQWSSSAMVTSRPAPRATSRARRAAAATSR